MASATSSADRLVPPSLARPYPIHRRTGLSLPVHYWLSALQWSGVIMLAMVVLYCVEKYLLGHKGTPLRMVHNPAEISIRFFGLAHYTVATYLLFSSKKMHHLRGYLMLGLFSLLAVAGCTAFYAVGGGANKLAVVAVFFFFLMHTLRDEVFFYRLRSGKAIGDAETPHVYRMSLWLQVAGLFLLAGILYPAFTFKYYQDGANGQAIQAFYWIRRNLTGFWVFHGGLAALYFALIAANHWLLAQEPIQLSGHQTPNPLSVLFSAESLYYWTIAHVVLGFTPKPSPPA